MKMRKLLPLLLCSSVALSAVGESVLVRRGHWPVLIEPRQGAGEAAEICSALGPEDVQFTWGGQRLEVTAIGPRPLPRLHALLIDASPSMHEMLRHGSRLDEAKRAAMEYVDALPDGDSILVATFNESLLLGTAPTRRKDVARAAIERFETGYNTALWDALGYLVLYLDTLPGEKAVIMLSDGEEDRTIVEERNFGEVIELASAARNLSVFPIGLGVSRANTSPARRRLAHLAERTGGEFFEISRGERLGRLFGKVLHRLESRLYLSYLPPAVSGERQARVKLRVRNSLPCDVRSLGSPSWLRPGSAKGAARQPLQLLGYSEDALQCLVDDVVVDSGPLFDRKAFANRGRLRADLMNEPVKESRRIAVNTPSLASLRSRLHGPEALLLYMLEEEICEPPYSGRPPCMLNGRIFLESREQLGRAMLESREDYRLWALQSVADDVDSDLQALLSNWPEGERPAGEALLRLRSAMIDQASDDRTGNSHLRLAGWLGDVDAEDVLLSLEAKLATGLLAGRRAELQMAISSWHRLGDWFPPAVQARILTPLLPAYDRDRELIGFYRFVLQRPRPHLRHTLPLPDRPLALLAVERSADQLQGLEVTEVSYRRAGKHEVRLAGCEQEIGKGKSGLEVVVTLSDGRRLVAYYPQDGSGDALCINLLN